MNLGDSQSVHTFLERRNKIYFSAFLLIIQGMRSGNKIMPNNRQMFDSIAKKMDCLLRFIIRSITEECIQHCTLKIRDNKNIRILLRAKGRNRILHSVHKKGERNTDLR
jgi:hypothetical protein